MYDQFGFFSNLWLFLTGVNLSIGEIWEVMDVIRTINSVLIIQGREKNAMLYRSPASIALNYPLALMKSEQTTTATILIWDSTRRGKSTIE